MSDRNKDGNESAGIPGEFKDGMDYSQRLFHHTCLSQSEDAHFLEFRLLQRLNLAQLQNELGRHKGAIWAHRKAPEEDMKSMRVTLREYGELSLEFVPLCLGIDLRNTLVIF